MTRSAIFRAVAASLLAISLGPCLATQAAPATGAVIAEVQAALDKGDAQHAANLADQALKEDDPDTAQRGSLLLYRGLARELLGAQADAAADFTAALQIRTLPQAEREQALLQRGFLLDSMGRLADAAGDYSAVIAMKGAATATALNNRANVFRRQNRTAEAQRDYRAALAMTGSRPQYSWYGLGQIAETRGDREGARNFYAKAVAADPGYLLAAQRLSALGDAPDIPRDPGIVVLRPPKPHTVSRPAFVTAPVSPTPIVLRQPSRAPAPPRPVGLRPALDATPSASRAGEVQLGAWRSEAEAREGWKRAVGRAAGALDGLSPHIVIADLPGKGRYYRLRAAPGPGGAGRLCAALIVAGQACLPARD